MNLHAFLSLHAVTTAERCVHACAWNAGEGAR